MAEPVIEKEKEKNELMLLVIQLLQNHQRQKFSALVEELHPYDLAEIYRHLPQKHRYKFLNFLSTQEVAYVIQELDHEEQLDILNHLTREKLAEVMNLMDNDDLADLFHEMDQGQLNYFLQIMEDEESTHVQNLLQYPPDTAGGKMTNRFVWIRENDTVQDAVEKLKSFANIAENLNYLYVVDKEKKLVGVVSYRDLLLADKETPIHELMYSRVITVSVHDDQEEVARIIGDYDFVAVPVVDGENRLVGIVTVDDILDVVIQEANEDIERLSAGGKAITFDTSALVAARRRLPWLILLLFIGILSGGIISRFQSTLEHIVALAYFMPLIAGMTGNTGTQSLAVVVRGLSAQEIDRKTVRHLIFRELGVGLCIGLVCGILIAAIAYIWQDNLVLGLVVGGSLFLTLIVGTLAGTVIPLILYSLHVDPAVASGPLITTLNDIFSLSIYFGTATLLLSYLL